MKNAIAETEGRRARDRGIARAVAHADDVNPKWSERAFVALQRRLSTMTRFTAEEMRHAIGDELESPPDLRAWGGVLIRASRAGLIVEDGWALMASRHCAPTRVWKTATGF